MVFTSPSFLFLFLPIAILIYYSSTNFLKNFTILCFSLLFYAWGEGTYVILMITSIMFNYFFGLLLNDRKTEKFKKLVLVLALLFNLCLLFYFKYFHFLLNTLQIPVEKHLHTNTIHLPLGISFFTFQSISYIVDVYKKDVLPQKKIINLGLYISLFPQLIAGPIVRYSDINIQLNKRTHTFEKFTDGIYRFSLGLFKKVIIANPLGFVADQVFQTDNIETNIITNWIGILCYSFQIYYDFSGYSDMAIGLGKMFGFKFEENFNHPYTSKSIQEFWRKWHISLSTWFRDYLYIHLGGNRVNKMRLYINLFLVFFLTGLWHGASWNFVVWGLFHGLFMALERIKAYRLFLTNNKVFSHFYTVFIVLISWVFFRAVNLNSALLYINGLFNLTALWPTWFEIKTLITNEVIIVFILACIFAVPTRQYLESKINNANSKTISFYFFRFGFVFICLFLSFSKIASSAYNPFIYFRF